MALLSHDDKPTARIRRPGGERIRGARRQAKKALSLEARHRFIALAVVLVAASILSPIFAHVSPQRVFTVASGSMEPSIPKGSLVWTSDREPRLGDVVVYVPPTGGYQVHRIVEVVNLYGLEQYVTRGDANDAADSFVVQREWIVGVVVGDSPLLGQLWLIPVSVQALVFFVGIIVYVAICVWDARALLNGPRFRFTMTGILAVFAVLIIPATWAATLASYPSSGHTAGKGSARTPLGDGTMGTVTLGADYNDAAVTLPAPVLWKEIVLWPCEAGGSCTLTAPALTYTTQAGSIVRIDMADYAPDPTFYFEAYMAAPSGQSISAILYDKTSAATVASSEVSTTSTTATTVRSAGFTLSGAKEYQIQIKNSGLVSGGSFQMAKLLAAQEYPTATETQVRVSGAAQTSGSSFSTPTRAIRWNHDAAHYDGIASAYFEVVAQVTTLSTGEFRLVDRTTSTTIATASTSATTATRVRAAITLTDLVAEHEYQVEFRSSFGVLPTITLHSARIGLLQTSFTSTMRYVDLSWQTTTTSTSFAQVGHTGSYLTSTEWGGRTAYLEANLVGSGVGVTASADLFDVAAGSNIASSQVDVTGVTVTRVRSNAITLNPDDAELRLRLKTSSGTADVRGGFVLLPQTVGKTYDNVLQQSHNVVNACSWSTSLHVVSSATLSRISLATISIRTDAGTQTQVTIASGSLTQTSGTALTLAHGDAIEVFAFARPAASGASTVSSELRSTCIGYGIHMTQPVTFTLA